MESESNSSLVDKLEKELAEDLLNRFGPILGGENLRKSLGFISKDAFRQSLVRKTISIKVFDIEHRRGKFALTKDVARFLAEQRYSTPN